MGVKITVEEQTDEFGKPKMVFHCPEKRKTPLEICKSNDGFMFVEVRCQTGSVPGELTGWYTSEKELQAKVLNYLEKCPKTQAAHREDFAKRRQARKDAEQE